MIRPEPAAAPRRPAFACVLALVCAAAPALQSLHLALVPHAACAEDQELVEVSSAPTSTTAHVHGRAGVLLRTDREAPVPGAGGHDHCAILSTAHARARPARVEAPDGPAFEALVPAPAHRARPFPRLATYRVAPKTSPPRA